MSSRDLIKKRQSARALTTASAIVAVSLLLLIVKTLGTPAMTPGAIVLSLVLLFTLVLSFINLRAMWLDYLILSARVQTFAPAALGEPGYRAGVRPVDSPGANAWVRTQGDRAASLFVASVWAVGATLSALGILLTTSGMLWADSLAVIVELSTFAVSLYLTVSLVTLFKQGLLTVALKLLTVAATGFALTAFSASFFLPINKVTLATPLALAPITVAFVVWILPRVLDALTNHLSDPRREFGQSLELVPVSWLATANKVPTKWRELAKLDELSEGEVLIIDGLGNSEATLTLAQARNLAKDTYMRPVVPKAEL